MKKSYELLKNHPINLERVKRGKKPANSLWFWGEGSKPSLESFEKRYGLKGGMISAVDLLKGIGKLSGMRVINVAGATGNYDTDFIGKANACIENLSDLDFIYIHMEAPDECGHHGDAEHKIFSIGEISEKVVKTVVESLREKGEDFSVLICPDHPTPLSTMTHAKDPVPYMIYRSNTAYGEKTAAAYDEKNAESTGIILSSGVELMKRFLGE